MALIVSTHSRLKVAGCQSGFSDSVQIVSTHSRLKAAGVNASGDKATELVSTHSRLKAAGEFGLKQTCHTVVSTHSRLKAAGRHTPTGGPPTCCFNTQPPEGGWIYQRCNAGRLICFNTQPPEGGWKNLLNPQIPFLVSTHSRLKAAG